MSLTLTLTVISHAVKLFQGRGTPLSERATSQFCNMFLNVRKIVAMSRESLQNYRFATCGTNKWVFSPYPCLPDRRPKGMQLAHGEGRQPSRDI
jgi:hypothetical protein